MKSILLLFVTSLLFFSCDKKLEISKEFNCDSKQITNLEEIIDVKNIFAVQFPKTWKTKLFYDTVQSSIFTADSTKQLTETLLLDITYIKNEINFDDVFKLNQEQESLAKNLIQTSAKEVKLLNKATYYTISKGKKNNFPYQLCQVFIKIDDTNFILAKVDIYGDSLINKRRCEAFSLIEKIKIIQ